jgi:hypothetical protein
MMAYKFIVFLPVRILLAIRPTIARGPKASQKGIYMPPSIWSTRYHLLRIEPSVSFCKLSSSKLAPRLAVRAVLPLST